MFLLYVKADFAQAGMLSIELRGDYSIGLYLRQGAKERSLGQKRQGNLGVCNKKVALSANLTAK